MAPRPQLTRPSSEPPPGQEEDEEAFIGVPSGFKAERSGQKAYHYDPSSMGEDAAPVEYTRPTELVDPKYKVGSENIPGGWGVERIVELQAQMVAAGVLKASAYQRGVWDYASMAAYERLLATANASGLDADQVLSNYRQVIAKYGRPEDQESPRQPLILQRRDPESLRALLGTVAGRILGGPLSKEEEDQFILSFNSMSDAAQTASYAASGSGKPGGPGGIDQDIDPQAQASKFLRATRPQDVQSRDVMDRFNDFNQLLSKYS